MGGWVELLLRVCFVSAELADYTRKGKYLELESWDLALPYLLPRCICSAGCSLRDVDVQIAYLGALDPPTGERGIVAVVGRVIDEKEERKSEIKSSKVRVGQRAAAT